MFRVLALVGLIFSVQSTASQSSREAEVTIPLFPPTSLAGRVRFESVAAGSAAVAVMLRGSGGQFTSPVAANGDFSFPSLPVSNYSVLVTTPSLPDGYVKSMQIDNVDVLNDAFRIDGLPKGQLQIVVAAMGGSIEGRVMNERQQPVIGATVALLPDGMPPFRADRYRSASVDSSGTFQFRGLPPGEYHVYAWEDVDNGAWFNPAFLRNYENYRHAIRIGDSQKATVDMIAAPVAP